MAERFKYGKRYWYPHLKPADIAIWERFIDKYPDIFDECEYDVIVGSGPEFDTKVNTESGGDVSMLYKRKIDVVAYKAEKIWIVELKPRAGTSAIGQVKGYWRLFLHDYDTGITPGMMIITDALLPDMKMLAEEENVTLLIV